jgi:glutathione synthase/RimK-type ligase-like ATP-grasp enzyme
VNVRPRVAIVTCARLPSLFAEEAEVPTRLSARGVDAEAVVWSDPAVDWGRFDAVVIRSVWDYFERFPEFREWLSRLESRVPVLNPVSLVKWNADKRYLRDLSARGIATAPTVFCEPGERPDLRMILEREGWDRAVVKPAVSGGAWRTLRIDAETISRGQSLLDEILLADTAALVQAFVPEIAEGERSVFFFDGEFSHAVVKIPQEGEFRVQPEFGGTVNRILPETWLLDQAHAVIRALPEPPAYARIDGVCRGREFVLMEAELIEPYLFLAYAPEQMAAYVEMIVRHCRHT